MLRNKVFLSKTHGLGNRVSETDSVLSIIWGDDALNLYHPFSSYTDNGMQFHKTISMREKTGKRDSNESNEAIRFGGKSHRAPRWQQQNISNNWQNNTIPLRTIPLVWQEI